MIKTKKCLEIVASPILSCQICSKVLFSDLLPAYFCCFNSKTFFDLVIGYLCKLFYDVISNSSLDTEMLSKKEENYE